MSVIDEYLKGLSEPQRQALEHVRQIVHKTAAEAVEVITYGMPGFKYKGKYLISFGAFKDHLSVFPGAEPIDSLKAQLKDYKLSKGTIQFTLEHPLPDAVIKELVRGSVARITGGKS
jgi:uncharacterized protein YdhG (YjbR/CyaY superfamily)